MHKPIIFAASDYYRRFIADLRRSHPGAIEGESHTHRFLNRELGVTLSQDVSGRDCMVVGSIAPPDDQLISFLMLSDALRRAGANAIHAYLPYLGYARQDKGDVGTDGGIALIGILLRSSGVKSVTTIDVHSQRGQKLIGLPLESIDPSMLFAPRVRELGWDDAVYVAPDQGARERTSHLAYAAENTHPIAYLRKVHSDGVHHLELVGRVSRRAIIVDDILDTGRTLVSACKLLQKHGVHEIAIVITHGLFSGEKWRELASLNVTVFMVSDSHPRALLDWDGIKEVIAITPVLLRSRSLES